MNPQSFGCKRDIWIPVWGLTNSLKKTLQRSVSFVFGNTWGTYEVHLNLVVGLLLMSDALNIKPGSGQFLRGNLRPFKVKTFSMWLLSSCEEAWEGKQRSKLSTYYSKVGPLGTYTIQISLWKFCEIRTVSKTLRLYHPGELFFFPKAEMYGQLHQWEN